MQVAVCIDFVNRREKIAKSFAEADKFYIYNTENKMLWDKITNHFKYLIDKEIFCSQLLIKRGVDAVVCGSCEDSAKILFNEANIKVIENVASKPSVFLNEFYPLYKNKGLKNDFIVNETQVK